MKKSLESKQRYRQKKDNSYSTSGDDSYNNSIYQIRTNHQNKAIKHQKNSPIETQPNIIWVSTDNKTQYERIGDNVAFESGLPHDAYGVRNFALKDNPENIPQEVRMVLQARGSPPVELAAKIISKEEAGKASSRVFSESSKFPRDSTTNKSTDTFQSNLRNYSGSSSRVAVSSNDVASMSQDPDEVYNNTWYKRPECVHPVCADDCDDPRGKYCPGDIRHSSTYDTASQMSSQGRKTRRSILCSAGDQPVLVEPCTHRDSSCDARPYSAQHCVVRTNKNCNDSKTCDCCMETPKKVSTIYLCEKHPSDSRTYCCREVLDKDITPTSTTPNVVCVSPSRISRKPKVCECTCPDPTTVVPKRRHSCYASIGPTSKCQAPTQKCNGECRCVRRNRSQCKTKCTGELGKLFKNYIPNLICNFFKFLFVILVYIFLLWLLRLYTALNHYAHLTLLSANILMLFILMFQPDCLYIFMLGQ